MAVLLIFACTKPSSVIDPVLDDTLPEVKMKAGFQEVDFVFGGKARRFYVQAPENFSDKKHYPVVFALKRKSDSADSWEEVLKEEIESREFIGVYPESIDNNWYLGGTSQTQQDDIAFVKAVYEAVVASQNADTDRVYGLGISGGACMLHNLAVNTDIFVAIAPIAGALIEGMFKNTASPVSVLQIQGVEDVISPYYGGPTAYDYIMVSAEATASSWAGINHCGLDPIVNTEIPGAVVYHYPDCTSDREVILFSVPDAGHAVFSEYDGIDLTGYIFDFFERHQR